MPRLLLLDTSSLLPPLDGLRAAGWTIDVATLSDAAPGACARGADVCIAPAAALGSDAWNALAQAPEPPAWIALEAFGDAARAAELAAVGCTEVLALPQTEDVIELAVLRAERARGLALDNRALREALAPPQSFGGLVSRDHALARVFQVLRAVADTRAPVLLQGESGTGKTELARALHDASARRERPFVELNCGALPEALLEAELFGHAKGAFTGASRERAGRFEAAHEGSLFLDEIASASPALQVKLLRVLESGRLERLGETRTRAVDVRLVCASNRDLAEEVRAGRFREDLYFRVHVVAVRVPPLRERPGDVALLAEHYLARYRALHGRGPRSIAPDALARLAAHAWPGNVRELAHAMERAALLCASARFEAAHVDSIVPPEPLQLVHGMPRPAAAGSPNTEVRGDANGARAQSHAPGAPASAVGDASDEAPRDPPLGPLKAAMAIPERRFLMRALEACGGNRERAAELLGINRATLFHKLRKHGIRRSA